MTCPDPAPTTARPPAAPRRRVSWPEVLPPVIALVIGLVVMARAEAMAFDGTIFLRYARQLAGEWGPPQSVWEVMRSQHQHPGYPLLVWAVHSASGPWLPADPVLGWERAGQLVSLTAGVGLVVAAGALGRVLLGRAAGFAAGLLVAVASGFALSRADVLSDPAGLALLTWSAVHAVRCLDCGRRSDAALCGLAGGLGYLVRPEAIQIAMLAGGVLAWRAMTAHGTLRRNAVVCLAAMALPAAICCVPYVLLKGSLLTKKAHLTATSEARTNPVALPLMRLSAAAMPREPDGPAETAGIIETSATGLVRFGALWARPLGYVFVPYLLVGLWVSRRLMRRHTGVGLVSAAAGVNVVVLPVALYWGVGYLDPRHVLPTAVLTMPFVWAGLRAAVRVVARRALWPAYALLAFGAAGMAAATLLRPLHHDYVGYRRAGVWLGERVPAGRTIIDPAMLAGHYANLDPANEWDRHPTWSVEHLERLVAARPAAAFLVMGDGMAAEHGGPQRLPERLRGRRLVEVAAFATSTEARDPRRVRVYSIE